MRAEAEVIKCIAFGFLMHGLGVGKQWKHTTEQDSSTWKVLEKRNVCNDVEVQYVYLRQPDNASMLF